ncbi:MAG: hypothetical protein QM784_37340 [Polyangiaceae bacterium]
MKDLAVQIAPLFDKDVQLHHKDADFAIGGGSKLLVIIWRDKTTMNGIRICREYVQKTCAGHGREFALIAIVEPNAKLPGSEERAALARVLHDSGRWIQVSALAFEHGGFVAATIRSVVTGITLLARQEYPHRVFENVQEAARFIEREQLVSNSPPFTTRRVQAIVAELRRQVEE